MRKLFRKGFHLKLGGRVDEVRSQRLELVISHVLIRHVSEKDRHASNGRDAPVS